MKRVGLLSGPNLLANIVTVREEAENVTFVRLYEEPALRLLFLGRKAEENQEEPSWIYFTSD
ncbi:hypothetical protein CHI12_14725 [Terribacillus saccharophilus]|uniref:Uncharacterized protein n=1 Tax=Terribacillus saccharophilus TaxID=361277 RepID=A0A268HAF4_9BACI|nr:hypothetical protein CHI12_14725 [Terribacillus saccharophilus]